MGDELPLAIGEVIDDKYVVESVLGVGGMGAVVRAKHLALGERVAIKLMLPSLVQEAELVGRFRREAQIAARLRSPHVVRVTDLGMTKGVPYMVMELLKGQDLATVLEERGALPVATAVSYMIDVCDALAEAHANQLVHRDLKPANIFLAESRQGPIIKVLDFGIAKRLTPVAGDTTQTSAILGSPQYMSPEQLRASRDVDARADVWALGVCLFELLSGQLPFEGTTLPELCASILKDVPRDLASLNAKAPRGVVEVVRRCLEKDASHRYASASELAQALAAPVSPALLTRAKTINGHAGDWSEPPPAMPGKAPPTIPLPRASDDEVAHEATEVAPQPGLPPHPVVAPPVTASVPARSQAIATSSSGVSTQTVSSSRRWPLALIGVAALGVGAAFGVIRLRASSRGGLGPEPSPATSLPATSGVTATSSSMPFVVPPPASMPTSNAVPSTLPSVGVSAASSAHSVRGSSLGGGSTSGVSSRPSVAPSVSGAAVVPTVAPKPPDIPSAPPATTSAPPPASAKPLDHGAKM
jgi:serine/threonine-protein kinase